MVLDKRYRCHAKLTLFYDQCLILALALLFVLITKYNTINIYIYFPPEGFKLLLVYNNVRVIFLSAIKY